MPSFDYITTGEANKLEDYLSRNNWELKRKKYLTRRQMLQHDDYKYWVKGEYDITKWSDGSWELGFASDLTFGKIAINKIEDLKIAFEMLSEWENFWREFNQ